MKDRDQITIYIRYVNGKGKRLQLPKKCLKTYIYDQIQKIIKKDYPQLQYELYLRGRIFSKDNRENITNYTLEQNSIFHVKKNENENQKQNKIILKAKIKNWEFQETYQVDSMVKQVKNDIANDYSLNPQLIYLSHLGQKMSDMSSLRQCGITQDTWLSAEYFGDPNKKKQFNLQNIKLSQSMDIKNDIQQVSASAQKSDSGGNYLQIGGPFTNLFSSAISQSIEIEYQDEAYDFKTAKQKWVGPTLVNILEVNGMAQIQISCQYFYTLQKLKQKISKCIKTNPHKIIFKNPQNLQQVSIQNLTVSKLPWQGLVSKGVLKMDLKYEIKQQQ